MLCKRSVCLRQLAQGQWSAEMAFWRFVDNPRVTVEKLIEGWSQPTRLAVSGRHVLAIQDTSEINFSTTPDGAAGWARSPKAMLTARSCTR